MSDNPYAPAPATIADVKAYLGRRKTRALIGGGDARERFAVFAVKCGGCKRGLEKKRRAEHQLVFCDAHGIMVGTWAPRLCLEFVAE